VWDHLAFLGKSGATFARKKSDVDFPANSVIGPFPHNPESLVRWCGALAGHHRGSHAPRGSWATSDRTGRWEALMAKPPGRGWLPGAGSLCWSWVLAAAVLLPNLVAGRCSAQSAPTANPPLPSSPTPPDSLAGVQSSVSSGRLPDAPST